MDFSNKLYVYVDAATLQDHRQAFHGGTGKQYRQIILFVEENVWEEKHWQLPMDISPCAPFMGRICKAFWKRTVRRGVLG